MKDKNVYNASETHVSLDNLQRFKNKNDETYAPKSHGHSNATTGANGFMSNTDKAKLDGIAAGANNYVHPNDANTRHVTDAEKTAWNGKAAGNHGHSNATTAASGFMSNTDKAKLDGIATGANNYVHPGSGTNPHGTTKADVGLGNVNNWGASSAIGANSTTQYATTNMVAQVRSEKANTSHEHKSIAFEDTRDTNYTPLSIPRELKVTFQKSGTNGVSDGGSYYNILHVPRYGDASGGLGNQLAFTDNNNIWFRKGTSGTAWGAWNYIYHSGKKPTSSDVGLGNVPNTVHTTAATGNTVAVRDSSGDITCRLVRTTYADEAGISGGLVFRKSTSDNYLRTCNNPTNIRNWLGALSTGGGGVSGEISRTLSGSWIAGRDTAIINLGCSDSSYASAWRSRGSVYTFASGVLGNNQAGFYVYRNDKTTNGTDGSLYLSNAGYTYSGRVYNAVWNDYAEYFPKKQGYITEAGDIIALALDTEEEIYELATENHDVIVGAHSDEYGMLIGGDTKPMDFEGESEDYNGDRYIPVGLVGRVRVKFKGIARRGMKIVPSDIPGVGRAFDKTKDDYDKVIGYLVENNDEDGIRRVRIKIGK